MNYFQIYCASTLASAACACAFITDLGTICYLFPNLIARVVHYTVCDRAAGGVVASDLLRENRITVIRKNRLGLCLTQDITRIHPKDRAQILCRNVWDLVLHWGYSA
jgi:hypothetical protein